MFQATSGVRAVTELGRSAGCCNWRRLDGLLTSARPPPPGAPQGVQVFKPSTGAAVGTWQPPGGGPITLAAQQGQYIAAACGALVQVLHCTATGRLQEEQELTLPQQASALALFQLGSEVGGEWGLWLPVLINVLQLRSANQTYPPQNHAPLC